MAKKIDINDAARALGRLGGLAKSAAKADAARINGLKGGRPHNLRGGRPRRVKP